MSAKTAPTNAAERLIRESRDHAYQQPLLLLLRGKSNEEALDVLTQLIEQSTNVRNVWSDIMRKEGRKDHFALSPCDCAGYLGLWLACNTAIGDPNPEGPRGSVERALNLYHHLVKCLRLSPGTDEAKAREWTICELVMQCLWLIHSNVEFEKENWLKLVYISLHRVPDEFNKCMTWWSKGVKQGVAITLAKYLRDQPAKVAELVSFNPVPDPVSVIRHLWRAVIARDHGYSSRTSLIRMIEVIEPLVLTDYRATDHVAELPESLKSEAVFGLCVKASVRASNRVLIFAAAMRKLITDLSKQRMHNWFCFQRLEFSFDDFTVSKIVFKVMTNHVDLCSEPVEVQRRKVQEGALGLGKEVQSILDGSKITNQPVISIEAEYIQPITPVPNSSSEKEVFTLGLGETV